MLPEEPFALNHPSMQVAIKEFGEEIERFVTFFKTADFTTQHPVFGNLNFKRMGTFAL